MVERRRNATTVITAAGIDAVMVRPTFSPM
jgi:hypothetical protein